MNHVAPRGPDPKRAFALGGLFLFVVIGTLAVIGRGPRENGLVRTGAPVIPATTIPAPTSSAPQRASSPTSTSSSLPASTTTVPGPGALPQTDAKPTTDSPVFERNAKALWRAVVADDPSVGETAFFPLAAYVQIKAIADPTADWHNRLIADFATDVHALHAQLGTDARRATFLGLTVPDANAEWIVPGVEYNSGSYWRVFGSTLRYRLPDGTEHELPVTSLISWRGEWYVVHLGAIR